MSRMAQGGIAEPKPRDQIVRCERGQGKSIISRSAYHEMDWQLRSVCVPSLH